MRPITSLTADEARRLTGFAFDLDDTLLDHGELTEPAYSALFQLRASGLTLVAATGRPAGWGELLARLWPVELVVTENGAIADWRQGTRVVRLDPLASDQRHTRRERVRAFAEELRARHPGLEYSDDVGARWSDVTLDIGEAQTVPAATVDALIAEAHAAGLRAHRSSVHLHLTLDGDDKASGITRALAALRGDDPTITLQRFAYIGDSENDASCFAAFRTTIAVANFASRPTVPPRYVTEQPRGAGFTEAARVIVARRATA